jgi:hypothetical protein
MESAPNSSFSPRSLHAEAEGTALEPQSRRSSLVSECASGVGSRDPAIVIQRRPNPCPQGEGRVLEPRTPHPYRPRSDCVDSAAVGVATVVRTGESTAFDWVPRSD